jgi:pimeloyl-ACP methyl ester carboxylesterase
MGSTPRTVVRFDIPVLAIVGERDPGTPPEWARRAADQLTRGDVVVIPGEGHVLERLDACVGAR